MNRWGILWPDRNHKKKSQLEMLDIKNTMPETKNSFYGLISRLDTEKEGISELEYMSIRIIQTESKEKKKKGGKKEYPKTRRQYHIL